MSAIRPEEVTSLLKQEIESYESELELEDTGTVIQVGDGIARVFGLSGCMAAEMLEFPGEVMGMALNLEEDSVGVVLLGETSAVKEGDYVKRTGRVLQVPVGEAVIGRVINPLGQPLDGKGPVTTTEFRPLERKADGVVYRQPVKQPLQTGIKAIDSMIPIGRGQRELIIGDRSTGKSAVIIDTIINQKETHETDTPVFCIYVAIGQKESTVARLVAKLEEHGAMEYTCVISASASLPAPLQYIAPYAGCAIGEYFLYKGLDVLCAYDDLSKQAASYRTLSLLLRRPPGREAFPGDVFYLHSRLLERAVKLAEHKICPSCEAHNPFSPLQPYEEQSIYKKCAACGADLSEVAVTRGGSITALPVIETQAGDVSAYIPTNVISITDGQIYLESDLFYQGIRPAINVGKSVSRVGGNAQVKAMRKVAGSLKLDLAQYREIEAFAQFGSDLDATTVRQITRGERMVELLKQGQYQPVLMEELVVMIYAGNEGAYDKLAVSDVRSSAEAFVAYLKEKHADVLHKIRTSGTLEDVEDTLKSALNAFVVGAGLRPAQGRSETGPYDDKDGEQ
ncbi:F0F1 ATP synthase subunit alpha [bacterium]|nr:F0F1 ATP synthase subunit alpha [bacterium]